MAVSPPPRGFRALTLCAAVALLAATMLLSFAAQVRPGAAQQPAPARMTANTSMETVEEIQRFFADPANRVKIQFPSAQTQYAWQHMSRFYPTAQILREGPISELSPEIDPSIGTIAFRKSDGKAETVTWHLDHYPVDAFLVVRGGRIVFERYNTMRPIDRHNWFSASKVTGSTVLALLEAEGKVDVKRPVSAYLPQLKGSAWDTVTVEETLDMATGLDATEHDEPNHDSRTNPQQGWYKWAASLGVLPDVLELHQTPFDALRAMKRRKPGYTAFEYNSIDTFVINRVVEQITDRPLNEVFADRIWRKIGAGSDAYVVVSPQGYALQFGFISSNLRDMARFGLIFTPSWSKVSKERIVPERVVRMIQTTGRPDIFGRGYVGARPRGMPSSSGSAPATAATRRRPWRGPSRRASMPGETAACSSPSLVGTRH
jgi:CubicO group peptidase (beta-lactamase class C family)